MKVRLFPPSSIMALRHRIVIPVCPMSLFNHALLWSALACGGFDHQNYARLCWPTSFPIQPKSFNTQALSRSLRQKAAFCGRDTTIGEAETVKEKGGILFRPLHCQSCFDHSTLLVARSITACGNSTPIFLAAARLMTRSVPLAISTPMSPGFSPFKILTTTAPVCLPTS